MRREESAGGVVFRRGQNAIEVLVISPMYARRWHLPKGHREPGEDPRITALREVWEEGGVEADCLEELGEIVYSFVHQQETVEKHVRFFLMAYRGGVPENHDLEVRAARFIPYPDVLTWLSFENERALVRQGYLRLARYRPEWFTREDTIPSGH